MATSKVYQVIETAITYLNSGGSAAFTPTSLASGAGRQSAYYDRGTAAAARKFNLRVWFKPGGTRVIGEQVDVYILTGDGTHYDNDDGTGDIAVSALDKLRNPTWIGSVDIDENAAVEMGANWDIEVTGRYIAVVFWNRTANTLSTTAGDYGAELIPIPDESQ